MISRTVGYMCKSEAAFRKSDQAIVPSRDPDHARASPHKTHSPTRLPGSIVDVAVVRAFTSLTRPEMHEKWSRIDGRK